MTRNVLVSASTQVVLLSAINVCCVCVQCALLNFINGQYHSCIAVCILRSPVVACSCVFISVRDICCVRKGVDWSFMTPSFIERSSNRLISTKAKSFTSISSAMGSYSSSWCPPGKSDQCTCLKISVKALAIAPFRCFSKVLLSELFSTFSLCTSHYSPYIPP